jgi:ABC-type multidrug transport system fused ATPase/permease subunit
MRSIIGLFGKQWARFSVGQVFMLIAAGAGLMFPWTVRDLFAGVLDSDRIGPLVRSIIVLGSVMLLREVAEYAKRRLLGGVSERIVYRLRERVYNGILIRSLGFFTNESSGDISSTASNDINAVQSGITVALTNLIQQVVVLATVITVLFLIDARLAALVCIFVPPLILLGRILARRSAKTVAKRQRILGEIMGIVQQSVAGIEVIRSYLLEGIASKMHTEKNDQSLKTSDQTVKIAAESTFWSGILGSLFLLTVMGVGGYRVIQGALTGPDLIAFILYSEMVTGPFVQLASLVPEIAKSRTAYARIQNLIEDSSADSTGVAGKNLATRDGFDAAVHFRTSQVSKRSTPLAGGSIEFQNVCFTYDDVNDVLKNTSMTIPYGKTTALVGPSGAGKSTVFRLIPRLYDSTRGTILINGHNIHDLSPVLLRAAIGVVHQDPFIFDMSVADNIRCGSPDASNEEVVRAARLANADEFIGRLEHGYETVVGENGSRLSGGQRQRVAIARTFLKNPRFLLLDEATSALDGVSERAVLDALESLKTGRTTMMIAHRLETILDADSIIVLDSGTVVDSGTHSELMSRCSLYGELYQKAVGVTGAADANAVGVAVNSPGRSKQKPNTQAS